MFSFDHFTHTIDGKILADNHPGHIAHFLTDSRKLFNPKASVFVAIHGTRHNGHDFIVPMYERGVRKFVVENQAAIPGYMLDHCSIVLVASAIVALQQIASAHRKCFDYPVIAITGSNGKTIIKEWLGQLLENDYKIVKSPKSFNSQLGVPLSVLQMGPQHNLAIIEAGISKVDEMQKLKEVIDPTIGIFTNIGPAHDEGFADRQEKTLEKWKLFGDCTTVIYCLDHEQVARAKPAHVHGFSWGQHIGSAIRIVSKQKHGHLSVLSLAFEGRDMELRLPFADEASIENAMHCIATMLLLGLDAAQINQKLSRLTVVEMRLQLKRGINNCYLIDDSYNNDLGGLQVAIDFLKNQPGKKTG